MAAPTLQELIVPLSQLQVLQQLLSYLQGLGQVAQLGAGSSPPVGSGGFAVSGVPVDTYDVLVLITSGGQTSTITVQYSLDGGNTYSSAQSSSGQSPWTLQLLDYRQSNSPTGLAITFSDGLSPISGSWVTAESYSFPVTEPQYPLTDFNDGAVGWTILNVNAQAISNWTALIANVTAGGFTGLAAGVWLTILAKQLYNLDRKLALPTLGYVLFTDVGGEGPWTLTPGATFMQGNTGNLYTVASSAAATLPKSGQVIVPVSATSPGSSFNDQADTIEQLVTSMPGVSVSNIFGSQLGAVPWVASTNYALNNTVRPPSQNGFIYIASSISGAGTSGSSQPTWPTVLGQTVVDNLVTWQCFGPDGTVNSYVQGSSTATPAPGQLYPNTTFLNTAVIVAADLVFAIKSTGYVGQATFQVSTDGGLTFGSTTTVPQTTQLGVSVPTWQATHTYATNALAYPITSNGYYFKVTAGGGGNSGASEPAWNTTLGGTTSDGALTWTCISVGYGLYSVNAGGTGGPNLLGTVAVLFVDTGTHVSSFDAGDSYVFTTDWASQYGTDDETDQQLALRCQQQWATLAFGLPSAEIAAWAKAASPEVLIAQSSPDPAGDGSIDLYIAGSNGPVSQGAIVAVSNYVAQRLPGTMTLANGVAVTVTSDSISITGTVYVTKAFLSIAQQAIASELGTYEQLVGIGSTLQPAVVYLSAINAIIQNQNGVRNVDGLTLTDGGGGVQNAAGDITLNPGVLASLISSTLTFIAI